MSKKRNKLIFGIILVISLFVGLYLYQSNRIYEINFNQDNTFSIIGSGERAIIEGCSSEQQCINFYKSKGMPDNFLQLNNYFISCEDGICYLQK